MAEMKKRKEMPLLVVGFAVIMILFFCIFQRFRYELILILLCYVILVLYLIEQTERKKEAVYNLKRFETMLTSMPGVFFEYACMTGKYHIYGNAGKEFSIPEDGDITEEELISYISPQDRDRYKEIYGELKNGGDRAEGEIRMLHNGGGYLWTNVMMTGVRDGKGRLTHAFGMLTDIDEHKQMEEAWEMEKRQLDAALTLLGSNYFEIIYVDVSHDLYTVLRCDEDKEGYRNIGNSYTEMINEIIDTKIHPKDRKSAMQVLSAPRLYQKIIWEKKSVDIKYRRKDGDKYRKVQTEVIPAKDRRGNYTRAVIYVKYIGDGGEQ